MSEENLDHFFEEFKVARKSKKLSVADVAKETKIQKEYIEAIESGNFDILSPVYIRLFIKSYCEYLKIDMTKLLMIMIKQGFDVKYIAIKDFWFEFDNRKDLKLFNDNAGKLQNKESK